MKQADNTNLSFEEFKKSFSYGTRGDQNFKFLAHFSDEEAAGFFEGLLDKIGSVMDDGDWGSIVRHVVDGQIAGYAGPAKFTYAEGPFTKPGKPLAASNVALLTSNGHFVEGDDPHPFGVKNMTQREATDRIEDFLREEPVLSAIPKTTPIGKLKVRHGGYDINGALADHNVAFPLESLLELERRKIIGALAETAYSFVGACSQVRLRNETAPKWVDLLRKKEVDAALLVPI